MFTLSWMPPEGAKSEEKEGETKTREQRSPRSRTTSRASAAAELPCCRAGRANHSHTRDNQTQSKRSMREANSRRSGSIEDAQLVPQREHFDLKCRARSE
jgi:hypothetical protein